jgi:hypothetical protein
MTSSCYPVPACLTRVLLECCRGAALVLILPVKYIYQEKSIFDLLSYSISISDCFLGNIYFGWYNEIHLTKERYNFWSMLINEYINPYLNW